MYTEYNVVTKLIEYVNPLIANVMALLPVNKRHNSLSKEARCELSYNQGYRDALITIKRKLEIDQGRIQPRCHLMSNQSPSKSQR